MSGAPSRRSICRATTRSPSTTTASARPRSSRWAILGGAFGFGLKRNVIDIYKFACRNYRDDDDQFFGFGFSRGAFTIRVVGGADPQSGSGDRPSNEKELAPDSASAAYRAVPAGPLPHHLRGSRKSYRWVRDLFRARQVSTRPKSRADTVKIMFVGVWDTVAAYGAPLDEMTRGHSASYIWPLELPHSHASPATG